MNVSRDALHTGLLVAAIVLFAVAAIPTPHSGRLTAAGLALFAAAHL